MSAVPAKTEKEARRVVAELKEFCKRHGLWVTVSEEHKPNLTMIRVEEISIKVDK